MALDQTHSADSDSLVSSILPALSTEGRNFLRLSARPSQSVTALALLQKEVDMVESQDKTLPRCASLPHLKWKTVEVALPSHDGDNVDRPSISIMSDTANSEDRVKELESDFTEARDTIKTLQDTLLEQKETISDLTCQLTEERENSKTLREELLVSRGLCMELNTNRPLSESEKYYCFHETPRNVMVKEVGLQVAFGEHDYEMNANDAKNMTSPHFAHSRAIHQKDDWGYSSPISAQSPQLSTRHALPKNDRMGRSCDLDTHEVHVLHQQCREKEFQIQKLTENLSKYLQRNAEMEAVQISRQEDFEAVENKLIYRDQQVAHLKEVVLHQQEDIELLELTKENLDERCCDLEKREHELEELVDSMNEDMHGISKEKKKLNRHIKELNSSLENKQVVISEKLTELEAQSNLLEVIKQVAFGSPSRRKKLHTPRSVTATPRNSPAEPSPRGSTGRKKVSISADPGYGATATNHRESSPRSQVDPTEGRNKGKSSEKIPSKQERRRASRSLNYNECAHPGDDVDDGDRDADDGYNGDSDEDDDIQPINGFYNNSYVSSSEDLRDLAGTNPADGIPPAEPSYEIAVSDGGVDVPVDEHAGEDVQLEEEKFLQDFHGKRSSPKTTKEDQSVDELIAEVLAELSEEEKCEADKESLPSSTQKEVANPSKMEPEPCKMESEGLLLRKHELENYAIRARDRSWQYVYVVQHGSQLWFYESKEHYQQGQTYYGEGPLDLTEAMVHVATDYSRRKYVFRVQLPNGERFLFQARDDREMHFWVCSMDSGTRGITQSNDDGDTFNGATLGIGFVPPPITGSPSKTDRLRNIIKGSISALTK